MKMIQVISKNGSITSLQRYGKTNSGSYGLIDNLTYAYTGNQLKAVSDVAADPTYAGAFNFVNGANTATEYSYDVNGNLTRDDNKKITSISYNLLNLPQQITFSNGNKIVYLYAADGEKLRATYTVGGVNTTYDYCGNLVFKNNAIVQVLNEEGYATLSGATPTFYYYQRDHLGNNRVVTNSSGNVEQVTHYYAFGGVFGDAGTNADLQRYKYNAKELDRSAGLDWYDYGARHYDAALGMFMTVDPMAEKYYEATPYAYCGNNPVVRVDPNGRDWYQNNETKYFTWYHGDEQRDGFTYIGSKGSVLGEFESIIDGLLTGPKGYNTKSLYSEGFTFDIAPNDKGGLIASKERGWDFLDEFANGVGPEFSVLLSDHPYTEEMKTDETVLNWQRIIADGNTKIPGQVTNVKRDWTPLNVFGTTSMAKQFIGSYRYDAFTSSDGKMLNNVISDSNSRTSLFYHLPFTNKSRSQTRAFSNTYQFYIWKSPK